MAETKMKKMNSTTQKATMRDQTTTIEKDKKKN